MGERESRRNEREYERRIAPALSAMRGLRIEGLDGTCRAHEHAVCLAGESDVHAASAKTENALRAIGATDVRADCRDSRSGKTSVCRISARLHGADANATVAPRWVAGAPTRAVEVFATVSYGI
jgi:hypothetical protein